MTNCSPHAAADGQAPFTIVWFMVMESWEERCGDVRCVVMSHSVASHSSGIFYAGTASSFLAWPRNRTARAPHASKLERPVRTFHSSTSRRPQQSRSGATSSMYGVRAVALASSRAATSSSSVGDHEHVGHACAQRRALLSLHLGYLLLAQSSSCPSAPPPLHPAPLQAPLAPARAAPRAPVQAARPAPRSAPRDTAPLTRQPLPIRAVGTRRRRWPPLPV